ncbi:MAG TPA: hypothetical protein VGJ18_20170 [Gemmatimonadaceae bacterium]|jgi:hypothetical protein
MTSLLRQAFRAAEKLPEATQDEIGAKLLASIQAELAWDECLEGNAADTVRSMAEEAESEERAGRTLPLDPDTL